MCLEPRHPHPPTYATGSIAAATDYLRLTFDGLAAQPKAYAQAPTTFSGFVNVPLVWKVGSVADVDNCALPACVYYAAPGTPGSGGAGGGSLHMRFKPGSKKAKVLKADGSDAGLLAYAVWGLRIKWP